MTLLQRLTKQELIKPPTFVPANTVYLTRMGSVAYGVSQNKSDEDIYGVCIPPPEYVFPRDFIYDFDNRNLTFHQWQQHHIKDGDKEYDFSIYNIVRYFRLCMDCNPHVIDSLFTRREHVIFTAPVFEIVREQRQIFLHKGVTHRLKGYAYSQLQKGKNCVAYIQKIRNYEEKHGIPHDITYDEALSSHPKEEYMLLWEDGLKKTTRFYNQKRLGFDAKFMYHIYRLLDQAEYILINHDLDLQEAGRVGKMKAIRAGDISFDEIVEYFSDGEKRLTNMNQESTLQYKPDVKKIRTLLLSCLEHHYGSLKNFIQSDVHETAITEIRQILGKYGL